MPDFSSRPLATPLEERGRAGSFALLAFFFAGTIALGLASDGVYHDDDLTHFLMARWARWFPGYLLHIWGRPGFTIPVAAVAWIGSPDVGWHAARILSALVTAASAWIACDVARNFGLRNTFWVILLTYLQPLNSLLAATTLTENFAAFYLISAVRLVQLNRAVLASAVFSLILLTRHETAALLPAWWIAMLSLPMPLSKKILGCAASLWAIVLHQILFFLVFEDWPVRIFFEPHGSTEYLPAGWLSYVPHALYATTPLIAGLSIVGGAELWRRRGRLVVILAGGFFMTHVLIAALGIFASGGYGRFMVTISPLVGVLAAVGLEQLISRTSMRGTWFSLAAVWLVGYGAVEIELHVGRISMPAGNLLLPLRLGVLLIVTLSLAAAMISRRGIRQIISSAAIFAMTLATIVQVAAVIRPLRMKAAHLEVQRCADWIRQNKNDAPIFSTHPWLNYFFGIVEDPRAHKGARLLASMPIGTIFVWDSYYSPNDFHGLNLVQYLNDPAYLLIEEFGSSEKKRPLRIVLMEKVGQTPIPPAVKSYPSNPASRRAELLGIYYLKADRG